MRMNAGDGFTEEQKQYLDGFVRGGRIVQSLTVLPTWQTTLGTTPEHPQPCKSDKKLPPEEQAKRNSTAWTRGTSCSSTRATAGFPREPTCS